MCGYHHLEHSGITSCKSEFGWLWHIWNKFWPFTSAITSLMTSAFCILQASGLPLLHESDQPGLTWTVLDPKPSVLDPGSGPPDSTKTKLECRWVFFPCGEDGWAKRDTCLQKICPPPPPPVSCLGSPLFILHWENLKTTPLGFLDNKDQVIYLGKNPTLFFLFSVSHCHGPGKDYCKCHNNTCDGRGKCEQSKFFPIARCYPQDSTMWDSFGFWGTSKTDSRNLCKIKTDMHK